MKKIFVFLICLVCNETYGQKPVLDAFVRLPQVVNYNLYDKEIGYTPVVSAGVTLRYRGFFADIGSFVNKSDVFGLYTYFGSSLRTDHYTDNKLLLLNWFGEFTYIPDQGESATITVKTIGISPVMVWNVEKSAFALAFTFGVAFSNSTTGINSRVILNYSLPLLK